MQPPESKMINPLTFLKTKYWNWRVNAGIRLIDELDILMKKANWPRHKRRQAWRDLTSKHKDKIQVAYKYLKDKAGG